MKINKIKDYIKAQQKLNFTYIIVAIVVAGAIYGGTVYQENMKQERIARKEEIEQQRIDAINLEKTATRRELARCKEAAGDAYSTNWESECETRGLGEDCSLPLDILDIIDERWQWGIENCFRMYE